MWFERLTGFQEISPDYVRSNLIIENNQFISKATERRFTFGELEVISLADLKSKSPKKEEYSGTIQVNEVVADVQDLHCQLENENALFQVASQFNLLEMIGPDITPEQGIDRYENDYTQGPICAITCGAGTIYRNYFANVNGQIGQTQDNQIDCLDLIGAELRNKSNALWTMKNGYALCTKQGLEKINETLSQLNEAERELLKEKLKIGIQWNTEVTVSASKQLVSQIYSSALPVAYSSVDSKLWEPFARLILEATYDATLYTGLLNLSRNNSNIIYLTLVGGGAFGNDISWILSSINKAITKFQSTPLDVKIVSYGQKKKELEEVLDLF